MKSVQLSKEEAEHKEDEDKEEDKAEDKGGDEKQSQICLAS